MQMTDYFRLFRQWAEERNFKDGATIEGQQLKLVEEVGEIAAAIARNNIDGIKDGIGDAAVVLTVICFLRGCAIEDVLAACYPQKIDIAAALLEEATLIDDVSDAKILLQVIRSSEVVHYSCAAMLGLVAIAERYELNFVDCLAAAWDAIKDRKGRMIGGVFVKED